MRVLIADKLAPLATERLQAADHEVFVEPGLKDDALVAALAEHRPDALIVRSTKVTAEALAASPTLALVVRAGAGVNTIDLQAAGRLGVFVSNCPGRNAVAVAELVLGLVVAIDRRIPDNVIAAREGRWDKAGLSAADGLKGRTLGILGMGSIGQAVAARARAFEMPVVAWSRSLTEERAAALGVTALADPIEVARRADVLTVHTALTPDTRGLVGRKLLSAMKDGSTVINAARAEVVDEAALPEALDAKGLWAGLDVLASEPSAKTGTLDDPLARHPRVYLTHHIGASTREAQEAVAAEAARLVLAYDRTGRADNCVNLVAQTRATHCLVVRHRDEVGVLADVLDRLRAASINVQEMENILFDGGEAALARIQTASDPGGVIDALTQLPSILHATSVPLTGGSR